MSMEPEDEIAHPDELPFESKDFVRCPKCGHFVSSEEFLHVSGWRAFGSHCFGSHCGDYFRVEMRTTTVYISPPMKVSTPQ